jgi:predicted membrane protein
MTDWDKDSLRDSIHRDIHDRIHDRIQERQERMARHRRACDPGGYHGVVWGAAICAIGIILLLDHLGYVSADHLWRFWPMLIVVAGASAFTQRGKRAWGAMLLTIGLLLQLDELRIIRFHWGDLWPLLIIGVGLMMIWGHLESRRIRESICSNDNTTDGSLSMNATAIFGGVERRVSVHDFRRGTVNAMFGGAEIDFHDADIDGDQAYLEVNALFGGGEIRVPESWRVEFRGQTLFGGYSDTTRTSVSTDPNAPKRKILVITGTILFGGIEIKN